MRLIIEIKSEDRSKSFDNLSALNHGLVDFIIPPQFLGMVFRTHSVDVFVVVDVVDVVGVGGVGVGVVDVVGGVGWDLCKGTHLVC